MSLGRPIKLSDKLISQAEKVYKLSGEVDDHISFDNLKNLEDALFLIELIKLQNKAKSEITKIIFTVLNYVVSSLPLSPQEKQVSPVTTVVLPLYEQEQKAIKCSDAKSATMLSYLGMSAKPVNNEFKNEFQIFSVIAQQEATARLEQPAQKETPLVLTFTLDEYRKFGRGDKLDLLADECISDMKFTEMFKEVESILIKSPYAKKITTQKLVYDLKCLHDKAIQAKDRILFGHHSLPESKEIAEKVTLAPELLALQNQALTHCGASVRGVLGYHTPEARIALHGIFGKLEAPRSPGAQIQPRMKMDEANEATVNTFFNSLKYRLDPDTNNRLAEVMQPISEFAKAHEKAIRKYALERRERVQAQKFPYGFNRIFRWR